VKEFFLSLKEVTVKTGGKTVLQNINLHIGHDEQWLISGPSGSGKTVLAHVLSGRQFYSGKINTPFGDLSEFFQSVVLVEQQHLFKDSSNQSNFYYQQRFNSCDAESSITVRKELSIGKEEEMAPLHETSIMPLVLLLKMEPLLDEPLIQLSNGEQKRLQIIKALIQNPKLLILDQPFSGLDPEGRRLLHELIIQLQQRGLKMILFGPLHEIPECFTHIAILEKGVLVSVAAKKDQLSVREQRPGQVLRSKVLNTTGGMAQADFEYAVRMVDTSIRYGGKEILSHIYWELRKGDRCCISGPNGSGKSTLLSLISGDNPQAYANEIYLFDRRRGRGESIWDIKKRIGFVSPEMHQFFDPNASCFQAIGSGFFDTIGLFRPLSGRQSAIILQWLDIFGLTDKSDQPLSQLSAGQKRWVLLARALIKNPPLLVLDEPCQGLDDDQTDFFRDLIDQFCADYGTTLLYVSHNSYDVPSCVNQNFHLENGSLYGL
jgi:molybdate transport system ATP-binding protein